MKTAYLLRHGKSSWGNAVTEDHERPLASRGVSAARAIGQMLAARGWIPEVMLCSSARRTQETLSCLQAGFGAGLPSAQPEPGLYLASAETLIERLQELPDSAGSAMLIGHNDGMHFCAQRLVGAGDPGDLAKLANGFPTAGLAVIRFEVAQWADLREGRGQLDALIFPREID